MEISGVSHGAPTGPLNRRDDAGARFHGEQGSGFYQLSHSRWDWLQLAQIIVLAPCAAATLSRCPTKSSMMDCRTGYRNYFRMVNGHDGRESRTTGQSEQKLFLRPTLDLLAS